MSRSVQNPYDELRKPRTPICEVCGVDHRTTMADLSHGIIRLIEHGQERTPWMEFPISGDMIARQRAGTIGKSLMFSIEWPDEEDDDDE